MAAYILQQGNLLLSSRQWFNCKNQAHKAACHYIWAALMHMASKGKFESHGQTGHSACIKQTKDSPGMLPSWICHSVNETSVSLTKPLNETSFTESHSGAEALNGLQGRSLILEGTETRPHWPYCAPPQAAAGLRQERICCGYTLMPCLEKCS